MRFRNLHKWSDSPDLAGLLFFAQRLEELLFDYTLDTYKPSALNAPFLCAEAIGTIDDVEAKLINSSHLTHITDELSWSIKGDRIAKALLDIDLSNYLVKDSSADLSSARIRIEVLQKTLNPIRYLVHCRTRLKKAIEAKHKIKIDQYSKTFVTTLVNLGLSKAFLYEKTLEAFFRPGDLRIESVEYFDHFADAVWPKIDTFTIYFRVSSLINEISTSVDIFDIAIHDELPEFLRPFAESKGFQREADETFIALDEIEAFDAYSAKDAAERIVDSLSDLFALYLHKDQITWKTQALVVPQSSGEPCVVYRQKGAMEKSFDMRPEHASKALNNLLRKSALPRGGSFNRFRRIIDFHGICLTSGIPENQLLNLWIALETIVPSTAGRNKINNMIRGLLPFLMNAYVRRLVHRFTLDLVLWNSGYSRKLLKKVPHTLRMKSNRKVLYLLALKENEDLRNELYAALKDFHLLRFRTFAMSRIVREPREVERLLQTHEKKVSWQLRRIYRTRNRIVHSGKTPSYVSSLIENAHDYLDIVLDAVIEMSCSEYKVETLEQAFQLQSFRYSRFRENLKDIDEFSPGNVEVLLGG